VLIVFLFLKEKFSPVDRAGVELSPSQGVKGTADFFLRQEAKTGRGFCSKGGARICILQLQISVLGSRVEASPVSSFSLIT
jgi:hypothetical protein